MKPPKRADFHAPPDRTVAWWSVLLLVALALVLTALFFSGRFVLSLDHSEPPNATLGLRPPTQPARDGPAVAPQVVAFAGTMLALHHYKNDASGMEHRSTIRAPGHAQGDGTTTAG